MTKNNTVERQRWKNPRKFFSLFIRNSKRWQRERMSLQAPLVLAYKHNPRPRSNTAFPCWDSTSVSRLSPGCSSYSECQLSGVLTHRNLQGQWAKGSRHSGPISPPHPSIDPHYMSLPRTSKRTRLKQPELPGSAAGRYAACTD